jgi:hypothetical protein
VSAALRRLPPLATTGVGSLPFQRARDGAEHAVALYELPFCPQLPRLSGDMVTEWLGTDPSRCGWAPDRDRQLPAAWDAFALALEAHPPEHRLVKLQVTGPVTLAVALERAAGRVGRGEAVAGLAIEIARWLSASATAQARWLSDELGLDVLLVADEPGLHHAGLDAEQAEVWGPLRQAATGWGLHVCCAVPWPLVAVASPDVLSFDLVAHPVTPAAAPVLSAIVARGGRIAWGAVDAGSRMNPRRALSLIERAWAALGHGTPGELAAASLVSARCGTGGRSPETERAVARALARVAAMGRGEPLRVAPMPVGPTPYEPTPDEPRPPRDAPAPREPAPRESTPRQPMRAGPAPAPAATPIVAVQDDS